jgi:hydroxymethylbilane synthase
LSKIPHAKIDLLKIKSKGDKILDAPLAKIGGKGLFVKELEEALLTKQADIAVHSMKDVPMVLPDGLQISSICERDDPRDALISNQYNSLDELPEGSRIGTSSLRRQSQLLAYRQDFNINFLRGNLQTRLRKLDDGLFDAIVLSAAGLLRLGLGDRIKQFIPEEVMLPAVGQGAIGIESRSDDYDMIELLAAINHKETSIRINCERAMNFTLHGGCQVPIAGYSHFDEYDVLVMRGLVASEDGKSIVSACVKGCRNDFEIIGCEVGKLLLRQGASQLLTGYSYE